MKKVHKILIPVFAVLLAASVALTILVLNGTIKRKPGVTGLVEDGVFKATDFAQLDPVSVHSQSPYMQSDIEGIFYTFDTNGNVKFFEYDGKQLNNYSGTVGTITVTPELTYNKLPIKISYIVKDDKTVGYGLFTNAAHPEVTLYKYAFAKLIDPPAVYGLKGKMLLVSIDPDEAYSNDRKYVEIFNVDMTNGGLSRVFSQRDRTPDKSGRLSDRWHIITDGFIKSAEKKASVISGRRYNTDTKVFDIFDLNISMNNPDLAGIYTTFLRENPEDSSYVYLKKTKSGFKSVNYLGQETDIVSFEGDIEDYVFSGDWVYDANTREFVNLLSGKKIAAKGVEAIDMFAVNSKGTAFAALASYKDSQGLFIIDSDGKAQAYAGKDIFNSNIKNVCFADDNTIFTTGADENGACTNYLIKIK